jgi:AcrR family transcriptional regulator
VSTPAAGDKARRRYSSPLRVERAKRTRAAVLEAATRLFTVRGWAATGMRDIAGEAGVATETVYSHFSSKTDLLRQAVNIAVVGDAEAVPLAERPEFAAIGRGSRSERIAAAAGLLTEVPVRTAGFAKVLREAAPTDEAMADELDATRRRQRADIETALTMVVGRKPTAKELDGIFAVASVEVYLLLTELGGWSRRTYAGWMAETLERLVPRS